MSDKKTKIQVRDLDLFYASNHALKKINIDIKYSEWLRHEIKGKY